MPESACLQVNTLGIFYRWRHRLREKNKDPKRREQGSQGLSYSQIHVALTHSGKTILSTVWAWGWVQQGGGQEGVQ